VSRLPIRVLGVVMNDVRAEGAYRHYYYSYGYLPGYAAVEEEGGGKGGAPPVVS
jgi:hypothetical protein